MTCIDVHEMSSVYNVTRSACKVSGNNSLIMCQARSVVIRFGSLTVTDKCFLTAAVRSQYWWWRIRCISSQHWRRPWWRIRCRRAEQLLDGDTGGVSQACICWGVYENSVYSCWQHVNACIFKVDLCFMYICRQILQQSTVFMYWTWRHSWRWVCCGLAPASWPTAVIFYSCIFLSSYSLTLFRPPPNLGGLS